MRSRSAYGAKPAHLGRFSVAEVAVGLGFLPRALGQGRLAKGGATVNSIAGGIPA